MEQRRRRGLDMQNTVSERCHSQLRVERLGVFWGPIFLLKISGKFYLDEERRES